MAEAKEIWQPIKDYEDFYEVSNTGKIKSLPRLRIGNGTPYITREKILANGIGATGGYCRVNLCKSTGARKMFYIHRLVAEAFLPKIAGKEQVNHINGIKTDNNIINLEWVTLEENLKHAIDNGLNSRDKTTGRFTKC